MLIPVANTIAVASPLLTIEPEKINHAKYRERCITDQEYIKLINHSNPKYKAIIELLKIAGVRIDELTHLNKENIELYDGERTIIHVTDIEHTKSKEPRDIYLYERLEHLENWVRIYNDGDVNKALFTTTHGRINNQTINQYLKRMCKRIGIRLVSPHDFRHTSVSLDATEDTPDRILKLKFGWKPNSRMLSRYNHSTMADYDKWMMKNKTVKKGKTVQQLQRENNDLTDSVKKLKHDYDFLNIIVSELVERLNKYES